MLYMLYKRYMLYEFQWFSEKGVISGKRVVSSVPFKKSQSVKTVSFKSVPRVQ